jgi:DNA-binding NarL/FixJ family response regulator
MTLTKEESRIINLMTEGYTVEQIAKRMNIEKHIVGHRTHALRKKHGCKTTIQLVTKLLREEIFANDDSCY